MTTLAESGLGAKGRTKPKRLQGLLIGPPGGRKTVTAHGMPATRTIDFDDGLQSVEWAIRAGKLPKTLDEIVYETILPKKPGEEGMADMLNRACDQVDKWIADEDVDPAKWNKPYPQMWKTLIIDSASFMMDAVLGLALKENSRLELSQSLKDAKKGIDAAQLRRGLYVVPMRIQDWGSAGSLFMKAIRQWRSMGKNLIITAHEYAETDDEGRVLSYQPNVVGQLRSKLPAAFDEVWYMKVKAGSRPEDAPSVVFRTQLDAKRQAKTRLGCLDPDEPADFEAIKEKVAKFYGVDKSLLWQAYHGTKGRILAEQELVSESIAI